MNILIVDDSRSSVEFTKKRLASYGHKFRTAENGKIGFDKFCASPPDLVLMDIEMPVLNGFETARLIRNLEAERDLPWTPIIFLTDHDATKNFVDAIETGGDDFLSKRATTEELQSKIKSMTRIRALKKEIEHSNKVMKDQITLFDSVLSNLGAYVFMKDESGRFLYANSSICDFLEMPSDHVIGNIDRDILPPEMYEQIAPIDLKARELGEGASAEFVFRSKDQKLRHFWSMIFPVKGRVSQNSIVGLCTDITEVAELREQFKAQARTDAMTGIYNRRHLYELAEHELKKAHRQKRQLGLLLFDIDRFKSINDAYGHPTGDRAILSVVRACTQSLRETDLFGRLGGDEFIVVTADSDLTGALRAAERFRDSIQLAKFLTDDGEAIPITCSFGVTQSRQDCTLEELIACADAALLAAKRNGRNRVQAVEQ